MRVLILSDVSDPHRSYGAGEVCDLPDNNANYLIERGHAVAVSDGPVPDTTVDTPPWEAPTSEVETPPVEAAAMAQPDERATLPRAKKRGE